MKISEKEIFLFDIDNTILDFNKAEKYGISKVFEFLGFNYTENDLQEYSKYNQSLWKKIEHGEITRDQLFEIRFPTVFKSMGIDVSAEKCRQCEQVYRKYLKESYFVCDGAEALLSKLKNMGKRLYTVSNGLAETQYKRLEGSGLYKYFENNFISEEIGFQKPEKKYFDAVFANIKDFDLQNAVIVGDNENADMKGGKNAKLTTIFISDNQSEYADFIFKNLKELYNNI